MKQHTLTSAVAVFIALAIPECHAGAIWSNKLSHGGDHRSSDLAAQPGRFSS